jgi:hypothetical protein
MTYYLTECGATGKWLEIWAVVFGAGSTASPAATAVAYLLGWGTWQLEIFGLAPT